MLGVATHLVSDCESNEVSVGLCRPEVFQEAAMFRRLLFAAALGLGLSGCYYYAGDYDYYSSPYYYPYYTPYSYYYGPRYYYGGPRFYGGYRYYYCCGHGSRYYGGGYHHGHH